MNKVIITVAFALLSNLSFSQNLFNFFESENNRSQAVNRNRGRNVSQQKQTNIAQTTNGGSQQNNSQRYNLNGNDNNGINNEEETNYVGSNLNNQQAVQTNIGRGNLNNQKVVQTNKAPVNVMNFVQAGIQTNNVNRGNQSNPVSRGNQQANPINNDINDNINPVVQTSRMNIQSQQRNIMNDDLQIANGADNNSQLSLDQREKFEFNNYRTTESQTDNSDGNDLKLTADLSLDLNLNIKPLNIELNIGKPEIKPISLDISLDKPTLPKLNFSSEAKTSSAKKKKSNRHSYYSQNEKKYTGKKIKNWAKRHLKIAKTFRASVICPEF